MRTAYFDMIGGASGDMILGALLDTGLPIESLQSKLEGLHLPGFSLHQEKVLKHGFQATKLDVTVDDTITERHLADIVNLIQASNLPTEIKRKSIEIFTNLAAIEAGIHGSDIDQVHLHELGGIDTIVDVTGTLIALDLLGVKDVQCSPFPVARGFISGAHGQIPLPAPATVNLLKGFPVIGVDYGKELVTPTGAAILTSLSSACGVIPSMTIAQIGCGAGGRDLPVPNLLRVLIGELTRTDSFETETLTVLETNIDDLNPQIYDHLFNQLFQSGALDVTLTPVHMKKNRPGIIVNVLCKPNDREVLESVLFTETSTIGIRMYTVERHALPRSFQTVETPYGSVKVKIVKFNQITRAAPEFEDCRRIATDLGIPLWDVYRSALKMAS